MIWTKEPIEEIAVSGMELNRRDFHTLSLAAFGGLVAGALTGCESKPAPAPGKPSGDAAPGKEAADTATGKNDLDENLLAEEPHVCRGLNACKNLGKSKMNDCAGQGTCATAGKHACNGLNDCKGQGGCGDYPGQNQCKGKGDCGVPLKDKTWAKARAKFEEVMKKKGKEVGAAPEKS